MTKFQKIVQLVATFVIWFIIVTFIHEGMHSLFAYIKGCDAVVRFDGFWAGTCYCDEIRHNQWFWAAGGLGTAFVTGLLWWLARWSPTKWDLDDEAVLATFGVFQLAYGMTEPLLLTNPAQSHTAIALVSAAFTIPVMLYYAVIWAYWYKEE